MRAGVCARAHGARPWRASRARQWGFWVSVGGVAHLGRSGNGEHVRVVVPMRERRRREAAFVEGPMCGLSVVCAVLTAVPSHVKRVHDMSATCNASVRALVPARCATMTGERPREVRPRTMVSTRNETKTGFWEVLTEGLAAGSRCGAGWAWRRS